MGKSAKFSKKSIPREGPFLETPIDEDQLFEIDIKNVDCTSTYRALSSFIRSWKKKGGRSPFFIPKKVIAMLSDLFAEKGIDISNVDAIPYDVPDLHECLLLLARIQNKGASPEGIGNTFTINDLVEDTLIDREEKEHRYAIGEYVEILGPSMIWRLELVQNVLKTRDDDGGKPIFIYETDKDHGLIDRKMRWPTVALVEIFGFGPWVWQQWACLRLENKLSFNEGSATDFEFFDITGYVNDLWNVWLMDDRNKQFRDLYNRVGKSGQEELQKNIMSPFQLMSEVVSNENEEWNFDDAGISIFTYISLLGSGFVDGFVVFLLQVAIPTFLFKYYLERGGESRQQRNMEDDDEIEYGTRPVLFAILLYYFFKVVRDVAIGFNNVVGISDEVYSKIQSLRKIVWENGNDSLAQSLGFVSDQFMNTGYICILYIFNMWILFNVNDPFELLGSVIFFEFLVDLDEEIAQSEWWDAGKRFLKAGCIGCIMQKTIEQEHTYTRATYLEKYDTLLSESVVEEISAKMDGAGLPSGSAFLGCSEADERMDLLTIAERVTQMRNMDSKASVANLLEEKPRVFFGGAIGSDSAIFQRHKKLRAWSQWEKLLFIFPTPSLVPDHYTPGSKLLRPEESLYASRETLFPIIPTDNVWRSRRQHFWNRVYRVLTLQEFQYTYGPSSISKTCAFYFSRRIYTFSTWISFVFELCFPIVTFGMLVCVYLQVNGTKAYCVLHLGESCEFSAGNTSFW